MADKLDKLEKASGQTRALEKFEKVASKISNWLNWIAILGFIFMVGLTVVDVVGAKFFRKPVIWSFDVTGLLGLVILVFALAQTQLMHGHIEIEFLAGRLPKTVQRWLEIIATFAGILLLAFMTWQMFEFAGVLAKTNRVTSIGSLPLAPFGFAASVCFLVVILVLLLQLTKAVVEVSRR